MGIDLSQFHQIFFEESFEGLDVMENELVGMDPANTDDEIVNTIFRAAHSIKGGAGTFGFMMITNFTHVVETLLDEIRSGKRAMQVEYVDLFLQSVDCLRTMLSDLQNDQAPDEERADKLKCAFDQILSGEHSPSAEQADAPSEPEPTSQAEQHWRITMKPDEGMLRTGNEPFRILRELAELVGDECIDIQPNTDSIPEFTSLHPEDCYLSWVIDVRKALPLEDIKVVFEWVEDDCELTYQQIAADSSTDTAAELEVRAEEPVPQADAPAAVESASTSEQPEVAKTSAPQEATPPKKAKAEKKSGSENSSIRVSIDKVDSLINMVGELVITQSMLGQLGNEFDLSRLTKLQEGLAQLEQNTRELQESVMKIRMMPISFAFSRFPRLVRDLSSQLGKQVNLVTLGESTELDKTVMEKISDPLVHLVRNSMDHGLESPEARLAAGKSETGTLTLNAFHQGGNIVIQITDDGAGLNEDKILKKAIANGLVKENATLTPSEIHQLIFLPGFSTADVISDVSGRGVGMDVVQRNISALNGSIEVSSKKGEGSTFTIRLPLTLAILDGQLIKVACQTYILPLISIVESIQIRRSELNKITASQYVMQLRDEYIPVIQMTEIFGLTSDADDAEQVMMVVVEGDNEKIGLIVDDLQGQQQVVIKSLEQNYEPVPGISGATILGDGTVALIVDISGLGKGLTRTEKAVRNPNRAA